MTAGLADVLPKTPVVHASVDDLIDRLHETVAWITWMRLRRSPAARESSSERRRTVSMARSVA